MSNDANNTVNALWEMNGTPVFWVDASDVSSILFYVRVHLIIFNNKI